MRVHVLQHEPFEDPGSIQFWLKDQDALVTTTKFFESASLPPLEDIDMLIALGGSMSVNDELKLPWLKDEKLFIAKAVRAGKPVLGICLGAQLIASSLGARVFSCPHKEIGWFPVVARQHHSATYALPKSFNVFHWHGETFDLPPGATLLAASEGCPHQAFQIGARAIGLQFHLETTPESLDSMVTNGVHELVAARYIQSEQVLRAVPHAQYVEINNLMASILTYLTRSDVS